MNISLKLICFLFFIFLAACAGQQGIQDSRVTFIDNKWLSNIHLKSVQPIFNNQENLTVQVTGFNDSSYELLEYRIEWFSDNGLIISTILTQWTEFPAFENTDFHFASTAPTKKATSFKILIREKQ